MSASELTIITPVFEDRQAARKLFQELAVHCGSGTFVVAVDDGSVREPLVADDIAAAGLSGTVLRLRRNVGHQRAIATGIGYVASQFPQARHVVIMDSDGEDLPATIASLLNNLADGSADVVVAERKSRVGSLGFKLFYQVYKLLFGLLTGRRISFGNFMAINTTALHRLAAMGEVATHVAGSVILSRLRWKAQPTDRGPRYVGDSKMNFVSLALHGFRALMIFAEDVLVRVGVVCLLVAAASVAGILLAVVLKSVGFATPGWFSVALGLLLLLFLQTGAITLMTLLLTGIARNTLVVPIDHQRLIATVLLTPSASA